LDRPAQNQFIADRLRETANLLAQQGANRFRVAAYRRAAETVESLTEDVTTILQANGFEGLTALPGFGRRRAAIVRSMLADMLRRGESRNEKNRMEPGVDILLDVDREYRDKAEAGKLRRIAPRRFNPANEAWLPILYSERGPWQFSAMYSNTALAHKLGRIRDWVLIYFETDSYIGGQRTIVTEKQGSLEGMRVVRGREKESEEYYKTLDSSSRVA
jgi:DNA polymerase (family X)